MTDDGVAVVVDASVMVDLFVGAEGADAVRNALAGRLLHAPAHLDAEVLSALGRLQRAGQLTVRRAKTSLMLLREAPIERHELAQLLEPAWEKRARLRLADALYVVLADQLDMPLLTTDLRLARVHRRAVVPTDLPG